MKLVSTLFLNVILAESDVERIKGLETAVKMQSEQISKMQDQIISFYRFFSSVPSETGTGISFFVEFPAEE